MIVVDGRVLGGRATGIQHVARGLLDHLQVPVRVLAPRGTEDPRVNRVLPVAQARVWEQLVLPAAAASRPLLSLANTAPVLARHSYVFVHDLAPAHEPAWFAPRMAWYARTVALAARRAEGVFCPSEAVRQELISTLGVAPGRVTVVRPAVEQSRSGDAEIASLRAAHGLDRPYALLLGWADPRKDLGTALAAHRLVREQVPHDLVLVGSRHPVFAQVDEPRDPSVKVLGHLSPAELRAVLSGAEVLLHPSRYEGFGLPPLEAWGCGTPALIGDVPAVREATWDLAPFLPLGDERAWADALLGALQERLSVPDPPAWTWPDAGAMLSAALP